MEIDGNVASAMKKTYPLIFLVALLLIASTSLAQTRTIPLSEFRDKVRGAWAGKMIGVAEGFPTEFKFNGVMVPPEKMPQWKPEMVREALKQDDLYVQMAFARVLDDKGLGATTEDFGAMFRETKFSVYHASQAARRALRRGASAQECGTPKYNAHGNDIAFQINADFAGLMCPGLPQAGCEVIERAGRITCWGDGTYGGMFVAGMYAQAFFETDPRKIVEAGLACVPPESDYAKAISDVLTWSKEEKDWTKTWQRVNEKWDHQDRCPYGALAPLNIDAKVNGSYLAIGLLYGDSGGEGDFWKTVNIATRCGQDSDCNPSTAGGIWGAMHGYAKIPEQYTSGIPAMAGEKFVFTDYTFDSIVQSTIDRAIAMIEKTGGRRDGDNLVIKTQSPKPIEARQFQFGMPFERVACDDPRWTWKGDWKHEVSAKSGPEKVGVDNGAEASIDFEGTGALICGPYIGAGGTADVYVDGQLDRAIDVWPDDGRRKSMDDVWHRFDLPSGKHTLRLVVRGERFRESTGTEICIHDLIVYR
jgi:ADP-ribosylglycohydrolase